MTLKEALESKKPFRIKGRAKWLSPSSAPSIVFDYFDVLSEDWETQPDPVTCYLELDDSSGFIAIHNIHDVSLKEGHRLIKVKEVLDEN